MVGREWSIVEVERWVGNRWLDNGVNVHRVVTRLGTEIKGTTDVTVDYAGEEG